MKEDFLHNEIKKLINNFNGKNFNLVISKGSKYLRKFPEYVILYNLIGSSYQNLGKFSEAKDLFIKGLKCDHKNLALKNNLATSYKNLLIYDKAEKLYEEIIQIEPKYLNAYINLGNLKRDTNQLNEALDLYQTAYKINPNNAIVLYLIALAFQGLGNFDKTIHYAKQALKINPKHTQADHLINRVLKYQNDNWHYKELLSKIESSQYSDLQKIPLYFSLSKANEDMQLIDDSFKYLKLGNDLTKKIRMYDITFDLKLFEQIKHLFTDLNFSDFIKKKSNKMIFILGMPRSGTSLVEQIISSHTKVFGAGELPIMSKIIKEYFVNDNEISSSSFAEFIKYPFKIEEIANRYLSFINYFKTDNKFVIDKAPLNFRWIGFIKILFPNAKIIHCYRDPKNNCLSMYKNLFEAGLNFTYNESDLVYFYKGYLDLMNFWQSKRGHNILDVSYEKLINEQDIEIKKIIKYCELDWEENCLNFHKNSNPIKTMSAAQARNPIYKSSLNTFERYKSHLSLINRSF